MSHLKVHHCVSREFTSLAWVTPLFEFYGVAGPGTRREALAQSANRVVQWVRREEERVFIIGGAVSMGYFLDHFLDHGSMTEPTICLLTSRTGLLKGLT